MRRYIQRYNQDTNDPCNEAGDDSTVNLKRLIISRAIESIDPLLSNGYCFTVSEVGEFMETLLEDGEEMCSLYNRDVKSFLVTHYGDAIQCCPNTRRNESEMFFSATISACDIASKLKNLNIMREAGQHLRSLLKEVNFGLGDTFCDAAELQDSWEKTQMPDGLLTFFSALPKVKNVQN